MSAIFQLLGGGAKFNKKFDNDFKAFETKDTINSDKIVQMNSVSEDLDFFHVQKKAFNPKKRKADIQVAINSCSDDDDVNDSDPKDEVNQEILSEFTAKEVIDFRKIQKIRVYGSDVQKPIRTFKELYQKYNIQPFIQKNLNAMNFSGPTAIQMQSFPIMLEGRDLMSCAPTGSGKTLSFILPILHDLKTSDKSGFRAVIISPTRELAQQIYREAKKLSEGKPFKICVLTKTGAVENDSEIQKLRNYDILISTPLRLVHLLTNNIITLQNVRHLILDEADRLLELGFLEQMDEIISACTSPKLQKALYTATLTSTIEALAQTFMKDPIRIVIGPKNTATETIKQKLLFVGGEEGKMVALRQMVRDGIKPPVLIFVQSIERAKELFNEFVYDNMNVDMIHSERTRAQRDSIIQNFRLGKIWVLITTELMARGIDFKGVNLVINYDFPQSVASYIHRIGRTGRAGRQGEAITYFTKDDAPYLKSIVTVMKESGCDVPEWMLNLKKPSKKMKKDLRDKAIERRSIKTVSKYDENKMKHKKQIIDDQRSKKLVSTVNSCVKE